MMEPYTDHIPIFGLKHWNKKKMPYMQINTVYGNCYPVPSQFWFMSSDLWEVPIYTQYNDTNNSLNASVHILL